MPGLLRESLLQDITQSCAEVQTQHVTVDPAAVEAVASALVSEEVHLAAANQRGTRLPVRFDSVEDEINMLALLRLLDMGSGWDDQLVALSGRKAREVTQFGVLGLFITGRALDAALMRGFTTFSVFSFFGVDGTEERPLAGDLPITISQPGPMAGFVKLICDAMHSTGTALDRVGQPTLGAFIAKSVQSGQVTSASSLVELLAFTFPTFDDRSTCGGAEVLFHRKAQLLVDDLLERFADDDSLPGMSFPDDGQLTADSGSLLAAALRRLGVLKFSLEIAAVVDGGQGLEEGSDEEAAIRAAAVAATAQIAAKASGLGASPLTLGKYFVASSNGVESSGVKPHICLKTPAY